MFLIRTDGDEQEIVQLERDFSGIGSDNAAIEARAENDPEVAAFVEEVAGGR